MIRPLFLSLLLAAPSLVSAKDPVIRLLADRAPEDAGEIVLVAGDKRSAALPLPVNAPSAPQPAPARAFEVKAAAGDASLAKVALPDAGDSFLVLLLTAEKGYQPVVLSADAKTFKSGDVYFHNSSSKTVLGKVGTTEFTLEPSKGSVVKPEGASPEKLYAVSLKVRDEKKERVLSETNWPVDPNLRTYVFFFNKPGTDRVDFRAVEEFVDPAKKP
jgi:hypothetical protein